MRKILLIVSFVHIKGFLYLKNFFLKASNDKICPLCVAFVIVMQHHNKLRMEAQERGEVYKIPKLRRNIEMDEYDFIHWRRSLEEREALLRDISWYSHWPFSPNLTVPGKPFPTTLTPRNEENNLFLLSVSRWLRDGLFVAILSS